MDYALHQSIHICSQLYWWRWVSRKLELECMLVIKSFAYVLGSIRSSRVTLVQTTEAAPGITFLGEDPENYFYVSEHQGQRPSGV